MSGIVTSPTTCIWADIRDGFADGRCLVEEIDALAPEQSNTVSFSDGKNIMHRL